MKTIYLMKPCWLEDSLTFLNKNKSGPLNECDTKYTWELRHAKRVMHHREKQRVQKRKDLAKAKRLAAREEQDRSAESANDVDMDDAPPTAEEEEMVDCGINIANGQTPIAQGDGANVDLTKEGDSKTSTDGINKQAGRTSGQRMSDRFQQVLDCGEHLLVHISMSLSTALSWTVPDIPRKYRRQITVHSYWTAC